MKLIIAFLMLLIGITTSHAQSDTQKKIEFKLESHKYTDNVALIQMDNGYNSQLVLNTDNGLVVFGSLWGPNIANQYFDKINTVFNGKEIEYIVNDSPRLIHTGGNYLFPNAVILAQEDIYKRILHNENNLQDEVNIEISTFSSKASNTNNIDWANFCQRIADDLKLGFKLKKPNLVFKEKLFLDFGNMSLELTQNPFNNGGFFIWIPEEGILKTKLFHSIHIINRGILPRKKEDVDKLLNILDDFIAKGDQVKQVILHFSDTWAIEKVKERTNYLHLLWDEIQNATTSKSDFESVKTSLSLDNKFSFVKQWPLFTQKDRSMVEFEHDILIKSFWKLLHPGIRNYINNYIEKNGLENGIKELQGVLKNRKHDYFIDESELNRLGYDLLSDSKLAAAVKVFKIYTEVYPNSANAYDSLGEAYMKIGDNLAAITSYEKSIALNPENDNAREVLKELKH